MGEVIRNNVTVHDVETEIIESTNTNHNVDRVFTIENGDYEGFFRIMGKNEGTEWEERDSRNISANTTETFVSGPTVCFVKLLGTCNVSGEETIVNSKLEWQD